MTKKFDYKKYWIDRLELTGEKLTGVGHKRFNDVANHFMYKRAEDALVKVLDRYHIPLERSSVLDAGAGIGIFSGFYVRKGAKVTAIDLSKGALDMIKKRFSKIQTKVMNLAEPSSFREKFDIVHCFDVLYHIVDDAEWKKSVSNLARLSRQYIIVHDKYPYMGYQLFEKGHVRVRQPFEMQRLLKKEGFEENRSIPTHLLYVRPIFYPLVNTFPKLMYLLDSALTKVGFSFLKTSYVRVFIKKHL
ncbi:MAG: class I SAM-dependent methyltransferase [bacterium]|nr:class I SAM-dependent methyltransferase [bacterium]